MVRELAQRQEREGGNKWVLVQTENECSPGVGTVWSYIMPRVQALSTQCVQVMHGREGGDTQISQPHLPSWRSPSEEVLGDFSRFPGDRQLLRGVTRQDAGERADEGAREREGAPGSHQKR